MYKTLMTTFSILYDEEKDALERCWLQLEYIYSMRIMFNDREHVPDEDLNMIMGCVSFDQHIPPVPESKDVLELATRVEEILKSENNTINDKIKECKEIVEEFAVSHNIYDTAEEYVHECHKCNLLMNMSVGTPIIAIDE